MDELDYEHIVAAYHEHLYRFAFSLAGNPDDASELTQETFCRLLSKGSQLRDASKVKTWLFTTLYRVFLGWKRHENRFPHFDICSVQEQLPALTPESADAADSETVMDEALAIEEHYRAPLVLYYLQGLSYREIAQTLDLPIGTVMSRLSRGKDLIRRRLAIRLQRGQADANVLQPARAHRSA